jgi:DNA-binding LacI/PurR family transcriptional regulator
MSRAEGNAPTMQDVAALANVSSKTVSNVLGDYKQVKPETRARVLAAVDQLGYQINVAARNLRSGRTRVIGLAVPELSQAYFAELADAVIRAASARGYTVFIEQTSAQRSTEIETIVGMRRHAIDGLIFSPLALGPEDAAYLDVDFPLVVLGERIQHSPADHITMPNEAASKAAVAHLITRGRRRIAVIGTHPDDPEGTAATRFAGYVAALQDAGIEVDDALVFDARAWHRAEGAVAAALMIERGPRVDGLFCFNDALALGAMHELQRQGVRVPEDIAIVGFDDIEDSRYSTPALTTISPGREEIAVRAVNLVVDRVEAEEPLTGPVQVEAGFVLQVRQSTGD